jgi:hypothetical protein
MKTRLTVLVVALLLASGCAAGAGPSPPSPPSRVTAPVNRADEAARVLDLDQVVFNTEAHPLRRTW